MKLMVQHQVQPKSHIQDDRLNYQTSTINLHTFLGP